jgi:hypothetical protein
MSSGMGLRVGTSGLIALLAPGLQAVAQDNGAETQRTCEVCSPTMSSGTYGSISAAVVPRHRSGGGPRAKTV